MAHLAMFCSFKRWKRSWHLAQSQSAALARTKPGVSPKRTPPVTAPPQGREDRGIRSLKLSQAT